MTNISQWQQNHRLNKEQQWELPPDSGWLLPIYNCPNLPPNGEIWDPVTEKAIQAPATLNSRLLYNSRKPIVDSMIDIIDDFSWFSVTRIKLTTRRLSVGDPRGPIFFETNKGIRRSCPPSVAPTVPSARRLDGQCWHRDRTELKRANFRTPACHPRALARRRRGQRAEAEGPLRSEFRSAGCSSALFLRSVGPASTWIAVSRRYSGRAVFVCLFHNIIL